MKYPQRAAVPLETFEPKRAPWRPWLTLEDRTSVKVEPREGDSYVVVDEIVVDIVRLVAAAWPQVDKGGRLVFEEDRDSLRVDIDLTNLQEELDVYRQEQGLPTRPIRIGDTMLVRGPIDDPPHWEHALDVTRPAREAAKRALFRAVAPPPGGVAPPPAESPEVSREVTTAVAGPELAGEEVPPTDLAISQEAERRSRRSRPPGSEASPAI